MSLYQKMAAIFKNVNLKGYSCIISHFKEITITAKSVVRPIFEQKLLLLSNQACYRSQMGFILHKVSCWTKEVQFCFCSTSGSKVTAFLRNRKIRNLEMFCPLTMSMHFLPPHHQMETAIKFEPGMLEESAWAHSNYLGTSNQMQPIWELWYSAL